MNLSLKKTPVTLALLVVTGVIFLYMQVRYFGAATSSLAVYETGGLYGRAILVDPRQIWRLISPIFVHIGWQHVIMNGLSLYFVGQMAEQVWGSTRFLMLYLLSGLMGNILTFFFSPDVVSAGASTSLFGLFASFVIIGYYGRNPYLKQLGQSYKMLIGINLFFNLFMTNVGILGHIGGALGGAILAVVLPTLTEPKMFKPSQRLLAAIVFWGLALFFVSLAFLFH